MKLKNWWLRQEWCAHYYYSFENL